LKKQKLGSEAFKISKILLTTTKMASNYKCT